MKVLCVNQFYWPDLAPTGQLLKDLVDDLVTAGHDVEVLCGSGARAAAAAPAPEGASAWPESDRGVRVTRCRGTSLGKRNAASRLVDYLSFHVRALWAMLRTTRPDVLLVESTPPLLVVSGAIASAARGIPLVHVIHDLYPDIAEALGTLTASGPLARGLRRLHRWALHRCATVITLGPDMEERVAGSYGIPRETLRVISNWADVDALRVAADEVERLRDQWRLRGRKVVMYSGNLGMAHSFAEILAVADRWRPRSDTVFLFVGTGVAAEAVAQRARDRQLENIVFKPHQAWSALGVSLSAADVHLITQRPETLGMLVPSKLYGIMAVGRPAVFVGPDGSEVARTLQEAGAGFTVAPGDVGALERVLESLLSDPGLQRTCGEAGRRYMQERGSRARRTEVYRQVLEHAAGR